MSPSVAALPPFGKRYCGRARHRMPLIRFLYIGSYVCSTFLSALRRRNVCFQNALEATVDSKRSAWEQHGSGGPGNVLRAAPLPHPCSGRSVEMNQSSLLLVTMAALPLLGGSLAGHVTNSVSIVGIGDAI